MISTLQWILLITILNGFLAFAGALSFFINEKKFERIILLLVAFTTGSLIGGAFFHLIPEAFEKMNLILLIIIFASGFLIFMLIEKLLHWRHCHKGKCEIHPVSYLILYGDAIHNFIDGLIISSSFLISIPFGIITSILVMAHELPQEIGDFAVLVYGGFKKNKALFYNFFAQLTCVLGGIIGYYFFNAKDYAVYLLPFAAGGFIYIATMDLIPELFKEKNKIKIVSNLLAIIAGILVLLSAKYFAG